MSDQSPQTPDRWIADFTARSAVRFLGRDRITFGLQSDLEHAPEVITVQDAALPIG